MSLLCNSAQCRIGSDFAVDFLVSSLSSFLSDYGGFSCFGGGLRSFCLQLYCKARGFGAKASGFCLYVLDLSSVPCGQINMGAVRMRRLLVLLICMILCFPVAFSAKASCCALPAPTVSTDVESYSELNAFFRKFVTEFPKREAGTDSEAEAATFLSEQFMRCRLTSYSEYFGGGEGYYQKFSYRASDKSKNSQNVIGIKTSANSQGLVVIGAHYDNYAERVKDGQGNKLTGSQGAADNGTGVSVLVWLAEYLDSVELPFDLMFCLFGAEEDGCQGAEAFLSALMQEQRDSILLYINFDSIGAGDHLYLYCDEFTTGHENYLRRLALQDGLSLAENPLNRKLLTSGWQGYPYSHKGLASDNAVFLEHRINSAGFFSFAWSSSKSYMAESDSKPSVHHTAKDNLNTLDELYGDSMIKTMVNVSVFAARVLQDSDFVTEMEKSSASSFDYRWMISANLWAGVTISVWIALIVAVFCVYWILKGRISPKEEPKITVFGDELDG